MDAAKPDEITAQASQTMPFVLSLTHFVSFQFNHLTIYKVSIFSSETESIREQYQLRPSIFLFKMTAKFQPRIVTNNWSSSTMLSHSIAKILFTHDEVYFSKFRRAEYGFFLRKRVIQRPIERFLSPATEF